MVANTIFIFGGGFTLHFGATKIKIRKFIRLHTVQEGLVNKGAGVGSLRAPSLDPPLKITAMLTFNHQPGILDYRVFFIKLVSSLTSVLILVLCSLNAVDI